MKKIIILLAVIALLVMAWFGYRSLREDRAEMKPPEQNNQPVITPTTTQATTTQPLAAGATETIIGKSVRGTEIRAFHFGAGTDEILFVGGIHGGYAWNTVAVASDLMSFLEKNPEIIPKNVKVTVIPLLNPDGLEKTSGGGEEVFEPGNATTEQRIAGRFNANNVDLNRNFDCEWKEKGVWQDREVSGGTAAFSEPEAQAIRDYVRSNDIDAAVVWYSAYGGVFASNCKGSVSEDTKELLNAYAKAAGYSADDEFDFYAITGDMTNWFAKEDIDAISVLLGDHTNPEWSKNKAGVEAVLKLYADTEDES